MELYIWLAFIIYSVYDYFFIFPKENTSMDEESIIIRQIRKENQERANFLNKRAKEKFEKERYEHHKKTIEEFEKKAITSKL